jgi:glycosyltransferase involved in cell wall biosynthesis
VITFVNRNLEPYRGYHIFMRALPEILRRRPNARAVVVGGDEVSYGPSPRPGRTWKSIFLREVVPRLDMSRVHFVGKIPYPVYLQLLQVSAAHVYLTYPFVLSWSMLEAMAAGALVIGSRTAPVTEVIRERENGVLVNFFSPDEVAEAVIKALEQPSAYTDIRVRARASIVERFDFKRICLPTQLELVDKTASGLLSAPVT